MAELPGLMVFDDADVEEDDWGFKDTDYDPSLEGSPASPSQTRAKVNYNISRDVSPQSAASVAKMSRKLGWSEPLVRAQEQEAALKSQEPQWDLVERPITEFVAKSPENAAVSRGDVENLSLIAKLYKESTDYVSKLSSDTQTAWRSGSAQADLGPLYFSKYINDDKRFDGDIKNLEIQLEETKREDFFGKVITSSAEMLPMMTNVVGAGTLRGLQGAIAGGALGFATAGPVGAGVGAAATGKALFAVGAAEQAFYLEAGHAAHEFSQITNEKGEKIDPGIVKTAAIMTGVINAGLEMGGELAVLKTIPGVKKLISFGPKQAIKKALAKESFRKALSKIGIAYAGAVGIEAVTEFLQEGSTIFFGELAKALDDDDFRAIEFQEALPRMAEAGEKAAYAAIGLGAPGSSFSAVKKYQSIDRANKFYADQVEINDAVNAAELKERSPEKMGEVLDAVTEGKQVYLEGDTAEQYFQIDEKGILDKLGVTKEEIDKAALQGQDIDIKLTDIHNKLDPDEAKEFLEIIKQAPGEISRVDSKNVNLEEELTRTIEVYEEATRNEKEFVENIKRLDAEIIKTGATKEYANTVTGVWSAFAKRMALEGVEMNATLRKIEVGLATKEDVLSADVAIKKIMEQSDFKGDEFTVQTPKGVLKTTSEKYIIGLFNEADPSTILHETGHIFFFEMKGMVDSGMASKALQKDWGVINSWLGVEMGKEYTREQGERFARGFEQYLMEGKAPSKELETAFERFKNWLTEVYRDVRTIGLDAGFPINLTDDTRGVFDRLLATDAQIENFIQENNFVTTEEEMTALNLGPKDRAHLRRLLVKGKDAAREALQKRMAKERNKNVSRWRTEAKTQVEEERVYRLHDSLVGKGSVGMDSDTIKIELGEKDYQKIRLKNAQYSRKKGKAPSVLADEFGYDTIGEMVTELTQASSKRQRVKDIVNEKERAFYLNFKAEDAMFSWSNGVDEYVATLGQFISRQAGVEQKVPQSVYKKFVDEQFIDKHLSEALRIDHFLASMRRALRNKDKALKAGKFDEALAYMRQARLNYEFSKKVKSLQKKAVSTEKLVQRAIKAKKVIKDDYRQNIVALANRYGLTKVPFDPNKKSLRDLLSAKGEARLSTVDLFPEWLLNEQSSVPFNDLTVGESAQLDDLLRHLNGIGRDQVSEVNAYAKMSTAELVTKTVAPMEGLKDKKVYRKNSRIGRAMETSREYFAGTDMLLFTMRKADGYTQPGRAGEYGPNEEFIYNALADAYSEKEALLRQVKGEMDAPLDQLFTSMKTHPKILTEGMPPLPANLAKIRDDWTFEKVLMLAFNTGTAHNKNAIMEGYGLSEESLNQALSILSEKDWDAIVKIWDTLDKMWPAMNATHKRLNHFGTQKVAPQPFIAPTGQEIKGGYFPLIFDRDLSKTARRRDEKQDLMDTHSGAFGYAAVSLGAAKERKKTSGGLPPKLQLSVLSRHLDYVVQYITHAEKVRDISRVFNDDTYSDTITQKFGKEVDNLLIDTLKYVARPQGEFLNVIDTQFEKMRSLGTSYILGANVSVALKQPFSLPGFIHDVGVGTYMKGAGKVAQDIFTGKAGKFKSTMEELSPYMASRNKTVDRDLNDALKPFKITEFSIKGVTQSGIRNSMFALIRLMDFVTVYPAWWGAYQKGVGLFEGDISKAVRFADEMVAASQPSSRPMDLSYYQRSNKGLHRLFTMFSTFTMKYGNRQRFHYNAFREGSISPGAYMKNVVMESLAPPFLMNLMFAALWGQEPDKEKLLADILLYQVAGLPFIRDFVGTVYRESAGKFAGDPWDSPLFKGIDLGKRLAVSSVKLVSDLGDDKLRDNAVWAFAEMTSFMLGVPAARVYKNLVEGMDQFEKGKGTPFNILVPNPEMKRR